MATDIGKELRKLRIDRDERLLDMADRLGKSASFVSAVEVGKKAPPTGFEEEIIRLYDLNHERAENLRGAADRSRKSFLVEPKSELARDTAGLFARKIDDLNATQLKRMQEILRGKKRT